METFFITLAFAVAIFLVIAFLVGVCKIIRESEERTRKIHDHHIASRNLNPPDLYYRPGKGEDNG